MYKVFAFLVLAVKVSENRNFLFAVTCRAREEIYSSIKIFSYLTKY